MKCIKTDFEGLLVCEFNKFPDERGFFMESYNINTFAQNGINLTFVQDNISVSKSGVIRGMHGQILPNQTKFVRCISGEIYDVALDIRKNSPTFGKYFGIHLSMEKNNALLIPHGFLHGFSVTSGADAMVLYKTTGVYSKAGEYSVNPKTCGIDWKVENEITSERDTLSQNFEDFCKSDKISEIYASIEV
ncbi:dTDP-4-dehydrorhamnose 3,5-epimerase [Candidatus Deianiraea vastatrix]|uniref:dTDP-4-dehydrorhamnose 3,5-epimerase n=1 Tax=Candidatus Deianiraea vastatrix TaxID=2163644 RepID=A0A5B8XDN9_9RICK|nr:dTDP-4-dehydrorhamnose 3,5-epimerase [Candidatus Deianiraea vastatrix]QED23438.1 dTDP-4-dehydrorhamnose 3,5-epimerase [Candidatus Deianiraea vastatrix]